MLRAGVNPHPPTHTHTQTHRGPKATQSTGNNYNWDKYSELIEPSPSRASPCWWFVTRFQQSQISHILSRFLPEWGPFQCDLDQDRKVSLKVVFIKHILCLQHCPKNRYHFIGTTTYEASTNEETVRQFAKVNSSQKPSVDWNPSLCDSKSQVFIPFASLPLLYTLNAELSTSKLPLRSWEPAELLEVKD